MTSEQQLPAKHMKEARKSYGSFLSMMKLVMIVSALLTAFVIMLLVT